MTKARRFSELRPAQQALVQVCQSIGFGEIRGLEIRDGDPVFSPLPAVLIDIKLGSEQVKRSVLDCADFELRYEVRHLFWKFEELKNTRIERIEIRHGLPFRLIFEAQLNEWAGRSLTGAPGQPTT